MLFDFIIRIQHSTINKKNGLVVSQKIDILYIYPYIYCW